MPAAGLAAEGRKALRAAVEAVALAACSSSLSSLTASTTAPQASMRPTASCFLCLALEGFCCSHLQGPDGQHRVAQRQPESQCGSQGCYRQKPCPAAGPLPAPLSGET